MFKQVPAGILLAAVFAAPAAFAGDVFSGKSIYQEHCSGCHGATGRGEVGNSPDFSRGEGLMQSDGSLVATIASGRGVMPGYEGLLTDQEIFDVVSYLRVLR